MSAFADHFADAEQEASAARLAVWLVVASELLLFSGLFAIYIVTRVSAPEAFEDGVRHMAKGIGTANTFILLTSSLSAALGLAAMKAGRRRAAYGAIAFTLLAGAAFLVLKGVEYTGHLHEGLTPSMVAAANEPRATALFITLYWLMTGLHAAHVAAGMGAFSWVARAIHRGRVTPERIHPLELVTIYWHFVDLVWIFLWPAFYLTGGGR